MDANLAFVEQKIMERVAAALEKNNMPAQIVPTAADVAPAVKALLPKGCTVSNGGGQSLHESGVIALLKSGEYNYLDRDAPGADRSAVMHAAFSADYFLASANAITEEGEVLNIDGGGNRIAAITYGPANVILVVGKNKIVPDLPAAWRRLETVAAPANCRRLNANTPCTVTGQCSNCSSPARICSTVMLLRRQTVANRIRVILVGEELGY